ELDREDLADAADRARSQTEWLEAAEFLELIESAEEGRRRHLSEGEAVARRKLVAAQHVHRAALIEREEAAARQEAKEGWRRGLIDLAEREENGQLRRNESNARARKQAEAQQRLVTEHHANWTAFIELEEAGVFQEAREGWERELITLAEAEERWLLGRNEISAYVRRQAAREGGRRDTQTDRGSEEQKSSDSGDRRPRDNQGAEEAQPGGQSERTSSSKRGAPTAEADEGAPQKRKTRRGAWTVATLNVRRKSSTSELSLTAAKHNIDIMVLTELGNGNAAFACYESARNERKTYWNVPAGKQGVGFAVRVGPGAPIVRDVEYLSPRVARLLTCWRKQAVTVIGCYAPTDGGHSKTERAEFWRTLQTAVDTARGHVIVLGDFNADPTVPARDRAANRTHLDELLST
ncbi:MAG: hypothetical protein Q7T55_16825, partial [Solirubrobacteraceae bacterium]|nr:hypothetical protein [Solirubrobacteraceae bacterium]